MQPTSRQNQNLQWINYIQSPDGTNVLNQWQAFAVTFPANPVSGVYPTLYAGSATPVAATTAGTASGYANGTSPVFIGGSNIIGGLRYWAIFPTQLSTAQLGQLFDLARSGGLIP